MPLTKTIAEVKEMLPKFISNVSATSALPNFKTSELKYLVPLTGIALYNDIHTKYNSADPVSADDMELLKLMRMVAVAYAYKDSLALGHITLTDNGARKFSPAGTENVFKWEFIELREALINAAVDGSEALLVYLFDKKPALWTDSDAYKKIAKLLIKTGSDFNDQYDLFQPTRTYFSIRSVIAEQQERYIKEGIGAALLKYLVELADPDEDLTECIRLLKKSLAAFSIKHTAKRYAVRISDQGFTILAGEGDKDSPDQGRIGADLKTIDALAQECDDSGQDFLEKAKFALYAYYGKAGTAADFKTALDAGPLKGYINPDARTSNNCNRKGIFKL